MTDHNHRVYQLSETDRKNLTVKRESSLVTNAVLIQDAIELELPRIVEELLALGFSPDAETRPARLPLTDLALASLRESAEATGISQSQLLILSLRAYCGSAPEAPAAPKKTRKPKTAAVPRKTPKAKESAKTATGRGAKAKAAPKTAPKAKRAPRKAATKGAK